MAIVPVESYRDDETNKFVSREKGRAAFNPSINLPAISTGSSMMKMSGGAAMQMSPMESMKEVFLEIRDNTAQTVELLKEVLMGDPTANRRDALERGDTDDIPEEDEQPEIMSEDSGGGKGLITKGGLMKAGILLALGALFAFSDQIIKALAPFLKWIKEDVWPLAMKGLKKAIDGLTFIFDKVVAAFKFLTDPETSLESKVEGVKTAIKDFGLWLLGLFDNLATKIATAFGMEFEEGETLGSWIGKKISSAWKSLTDGFFKVIGIPGMIIDKIVGIGSWIKSKVLAAWESVTTWFSEIGTWIVGKTTGIWNWISDKVTGVWTSITEWFSETGTWIVGKATGIWNWISDKVTGVWTSITEWFSETGTWIVGKATGVWDWTSGKVTGAFSTISDWFSKTGTWVVGKATGIWNWISGKVTGAFSTISDWFSKTGTFLLGNSDGIFDWITDKLKAPFDFLIDLFTWPKDPSKSNAEKGIIKFIDLVLAPYNLAIAFFRSIFGFSDEEAKKDPDYEEFSIGKFIVGKVMDMWNWVKSKFKFDIPKLKLPKLPSMDSIINTIVGAILPDPGSWIYDWIPGGGALEAIAASARASAGMESDMEVPRISIEGTGGAIDENGNFIKSIEEADLIKRANEEKQMIAARQKEMDDLTNKVIIDQSVTKGGDTYSQDQYHQAEISVDHSDPTQKQVHSYKKMSDIQLKEDIKLEGKSPSDINIYSFKYKGEEGRYEGVMAQEVPWASLMGDNGYLMVDYSKLDVEFKRIN